MKTFLYHFHGLGSIDFSGMSPDDLPRIESLARSANLEILPTIYLRRDRLDQLEELIHSYSELASSGRVPSVAGFAVEGPLLGPHGGIPRAGKWQPAPDEWMRLAALGPLGLRYMVMAPDTMELTDDVGDGLTFGSLIEAFYDSGIRIALGHFHHKTPERSATRMRQGYRLYT